MTHTQQKHLEQRARSRARAAARELRVPMNATGAQWVAILEAMRDELAIAVRILTTLELEAER